MAQTGPAWRLRLLGGFELDDGQQRLTRLRSRAAMALLARLALSPGQRFDRLWLAGLLWPGVASAAGRSRLRQTLSLLKSVLEPPGASPVLEADRHAVWAEPGRLWCDATRFAQLARAGDTAAAALYRGALMPGFYDEWLLQERRQLEALAEAASAAPGASWATSTAPALAAAAAPPALGPFGDRLPRDPRPLVGAEASLTALRGLLQAERWVTVLGAGGVGKSRLATEAARELARSLVLDRALFVPLQEAESAEQLLHRLCDTLQLGRPAQPQDTLHDALYGRPALLLLDNAEALSDAAVAVLSALAGRLPLMRWLATSRRPLGLDGEHRFRVEPLPVPQPGDTLQALAANPAVQLYLARAREHQADAHLSPRHAQELGKLLRRLEGLPLAIELAAAQARQLSPAALLARLGDDAGWPQRLRRPSQLRGAEAHHGSLAAVIDASWRLLTAEQRRLLQRLCLPSHGVGTALALQLAAPELSPLAAHAALADLAAHSLLQPVAETPGRWRISEPVRAQVLAQFDAAGLQAAWRHLAEACIAWADGPGGRPALKEQLEERDTGSQVLTEMLRAGEDLHAARLIAAYASHQLFDLQGPLLDAACAAVERCPDRALRGHCQSELSWYLFHAGRRPEARQRAEAGLADQEAAAPDDPSRRCRALSNVVRQRFIDGEPSAGLQPLLDEAEAAARSAGRWGQVATVASLRAIMAGHEDPPVQLLRELHGRALEATERWGDREAQCVGRCNLATIELAHGELSVAAALLPGISEEARTLGSWQTLANATDAMSQVLLRQRRWPEALAKAHECLALSQGFGLRFSLAANLLWSWPRLLARNGRPADALRLVVFAQRHWQHVGLPLSPAEQRRLRRLQQLAAARVPAEQQARCLAEGAALDEAGALALVQQR